MDIIRRIECLRREMACEGIDIYIVPSADCHGSEYVGDYFKIRQYLTGFTGSAGTAVFTRDKAGLWTDGRYYIQAEEQLKGSGIHLYRMGEPDTDTIEEFLEKELSAGGVIGFDGKVTELTVGDKYKEIAERKGGHVLADFDLADRFWKERPALPGEKVWSLDEKYAGESVPSKLERIRKKMTSYGADVHLLSSLDDISWLFNIRGNDVAYCPVVLAFAIIEKDGGRIFADKEKFPVGILNMLQGNNITVSSYESVYAVAQNLSGRRVLLDPERTNYHLYYSIPDTAEIIKAENPSILMKSIKNGTEADNIRTAHLKDGIAHTRFLYWLKKSIGKVPITEISAARKLEEFRAEQENFLGPSFAPISAAGSHGAIVHYSATEDSDMELQEGTLYLSDTGGHYLEGSTDITRTVALGNVPEEQKKHFTIVARGMLRLANAVFLYGSSGVTLDALAREVFWKERLNFNHGTGHGVGYLLNIHEPPINFRWREGAQPSRIFEENMVITDEPGIYIEGSHGIRLENELLVRKDVKNEYGQFMRFEILTFVPIDLDALVPECMSEDEKHLLNTYHKNVYKKISPYLNEEEKAWLRYATRPI